MQNHPYVKGTPQLPQAQMELALSFIEDSQRLPPKCREFLNSVCKYLIKPPLPQQQQQQPQTQTQRPNNPNNYIMADPTKTSPMMNKIPGNVQNPSMMMQQQSQLKFFFLNYKNFIIFLSED